MVAVCCSELLDGVCTATERGSVSGTRGFVTPLIVAPDGSRNVFSRGDDHLNVETRRRPEIIDGKDVRGIGHCDNQRCAGDVDRHDRILLGEFEWNSPDHIGPDLELREVDCGHAKFSAEEGGELGFIKVPEASESCLQPARSFQALFGVSFELRKRDGSRRGRGENGKHASAAEWASIGCIRKISEALHTPGWHRPLESPAFRLVRPTSLAFSCGRVKHTTVEFEHRVPAREAGAGTSPQDEDAADS